MGVVRVRYFELLLYYIFKQRDSGKGDQLKQDITKLIFSSCLTKWGKTAEKKSPNLTCKSSLHQITHNSFFIPFFQSFSFLKVCLKLPNLKISDHNRKKKKTKEKSLFKFALKSQLFFLRKNKATFLQISSNFSPAFIERSYLQQGKA